MDERPARLQLQQELVDQGVIFTDIISAVKNHPELVKKYFMKDAVQVNEHKLTAFHAALVNGGIFLYVPKKCRSESTNSSCFRTR